MKSVYIRERKPYTKSELMALFSEIDTNQLNVFIRNLKVYGILKSIKGMPKNLELSNLVTLDDNLVDGIDSQDNSCYVFNYVGVVIIEGYLLCCYPKYLFSHDNIDDKIECRKLLNKSLRFYIDIIQILNSYNYIVRMTNCHRLTE